MKSVLSQKQREKIKQGLKRVKARRQQHTQLEQREEEEEDEGETRELLEPTEESETVQVNFTFCDAKQDDEPWLRSLMSNGWMGRLLTQDDDAIRHLAKECSNQVEVGTFIKTEDDEESVLAFATVLDSKTHLPEKLKKKLATHLRVDRVGWVIREAIVNIPSPVTIQLMTCLKEDIMWAEQQKYTKYDHFLIFVPFYEDHAQGESDEASKKKKSKRQLEYAMSEDFILGNASNKSEIFHLPRPKPVEGVDAPESVEHAAFGCQALIFERKMFFDAIDQLASVEM